MWAAANVGGEWDDRQDMYAVDSCGPQSQKWAVDLSRVCVCVCMWGSVGVCVSVIWLLL